MKISIVSDLHCRDGHLPPSLDPMNLEPADVLVVAGDIGIRDDRDDAIDKLESGSAGKFRHVIVVKGNHDYYTSRNYYNNVVYPSEEDNFVDLFTDVMDPEGSRMFKFICSPLWTPIYHHELIRRSLNDYNCIPGFDTYACTNLFWKNLEWIEKCVEACDKDGTIPIVVTHHAPRIELLDPKYADSDINEAFYVTGEEASKRIAALQVPLWIHGHCHDFKDMQIGKTRYVRNPYGYESSMAREVTGYNDSYVVEI